MFLNAPVRSQIIACLIMPPTTGIVDYSVFMRWTVKSVVNRFARYGPTAEKLLADFVNKEACNA